MSRLVIPNRFHDGQTLVAADLDANFTAVKTLINTTKLDADNFRQFGGITNARKTKPYAHAPMHMLLPQITQAPSATVDYKGLLSFPHYAQYQTKPIDLSAGDGTVSDKNAAHGDGFQVVNCQGCYHGATNLAAGDSITLLINGRAKGGSSLNVTASFSIKNDNAIQTAAGIAGIFDYVDAQIRVITDATAGTRTVNNLMAVLWLLLPHVQ